MKMLFFVDSVFPYGAAWSSRARSFAKLFIELGYDIHIISTYSYEVNNKPDIIYDYNGFTYQFLKNKAGKFDRFFNSRLALKAIKKHIMLNDTDIFFSTRCPDIFDSLQKFLKKRNIPMYMEQCEWFDRASFKLGRFDPYYRKLDHQINYRYRECDGLIAISSLLEKHYMKQGSNVIKIPTILDTDQIGYTLDSFQDNILKLVFAGSIEGKKELMLPIFKAIDKLGKLSYRIEFNILGPDETSLLENIDHDKELLARIKHSLRIHGKVPQKEVTNFLKMSDFMIFIRPNRQSSNAGFPTKLAESLSVGTPVITNITSDIGDYLCDGVNGFVVEQITEDYIIDVFNKVFSLSKDDYKQMRIKSRETAELYFDYKQYIMHVKDLFNLNRN